MKKWLLVLGMITSILGMSACGSEKAEAVDLGITEADAVVYGEQVVETMAVICSDAQYAAQKEEFMADPIWGAAVSSWESAMPDMGSYVGTLDTTVEINEDGAVINVGVDGEDHDAKVEVIIDEELMITSISTNVEYSFGELMYKAALNTLLGMGTVFVVLILISGIISCFKFIPKIQAAFSKKPQEEQKVVTTTVDNTIAQIVEKEELSDDLELVAVIAAAVAASEGATSTDGFVVRSIRKRRY